MAAVAQDGDALEFASDEMKNELGYVSKTQGLAMYWWPTRY